VAVITKTTSGLTAAFIAFALFGAACSSASSPEVVDPTNPPVESVDENVATEDPGSDVPPEQDADESTPAAESSGEASEMVEVVNDDQPAIPAPEALQFTAPLVGGGEIDVAAGFDNKPTLFWFWAPN
jgi:hypothetical protein